MNVSVCVLVCPKIKYTYAALINANILGIIDI